MSWLIDSSKYQAWLASAIIYPGAGKVTKSMGLMYEAHLPGAAVGSLCRVTYSGPSGEAAVDAEVVGFKDKRILLMPFENVQGVNNDSLVTLVDRRSSVKVGPELLGRVLNAQGQPIDDKGPLFRENHSVLEKSLYENPTHVLKRENIDRPLDLGVRAINGLLTTGKGQRVGIMAGSGVGKSVLLGMMAKNTTADVNVIALIGERGREVREFIERDLGEEGLKRSVVVVATSDNSPLLRMRGAYLATSIAEYFRDQEQDVLLLMDSLTRFSMAQREIGLALGEPPAAKGYTPSVFASLPKLLERTGTREGKGSITGLYTVLVEGDDMDDPIADSARSILDGHFVLSRRLAQLNHYPALDILQSTSRVMPMVASEEHQNFADQFRTLMAIYEKNEDLINIGAYVQGTHPQIDLAIALKSRVDAYLKQKKDEKVTFSQSVGELQAIIRMGENMSNTQSSNSYQRAQGL